MVLIMKLTVWMDYPAVDRLALEDHPLSFDPGYLLRALIRHVVTQARRSSHVIQRHHSASLRMPSQAHRSLMHPRHLICLLSRKVSSNFPKYDIYSFLKTSLIL